MNHRTVLAGALAAALLTGTLVAQDKAPWEVTQPRGKTRSIAFTTTEGTWMSVDQSPNGQWLVFDLLGHIYRMPATGGTATALTQSTGIAINTHPRISPDGKLIAFVSDRKGQNNLWIMNADGTEPRAVFTDNAVRVSMPAWTPDGQYLVVVRQGLPTGGQPGSGGLWMYHKDGGTGVELLASSRQPGATWPGVSRDGRYLYYQASAGSWQPGYGGRPDFLGGSAQVRRLDLKTGEIIPISFGEQSQQVQTSSGGMAAPEVSPDGKWLAFVRRIPDGTISWKGHTFGPRSALWLRNLETGAERLAMDPVEQDMVEGGKVLRPFPGYSWSADGRSIVVTQGGQLRRLDVASGAVSTIPFSATVDRTISELANTQSRITDDPFPVRFTRWQTASPDGKKLAFQAVGRIWLMDLPGGTPRRLTGAGFEPFEYAPAWSPDGQWLAFTSWTDSIGGHLYRIRASGGTAEALTRQPAEYINPAWSQDGAELVVARGAGESRRGRGVVWNAYWDLVRVPAAGGAANFVTRVNSSLDGNAGSAFNNIRSQIVRPSYGPDGRIFYPQLAATTTGLESTLYSVRPDGLDRRAHFTFPYADEVVASPDGRWIAFQESDNVYVTPFPYAGSGSAPVRIDRSRAKLPTTKLSKEGGLFPRWRDNATVEFGSANRYFAYSVDAKRADTTEIKLVVPRDIPAGTAAFTNARIVTLAKRQVITGTVVVRGGRISCVGTCSTAGIDKIVNANGKTIIPGFVDMHAHHYREWRGMRPTHDYEQAIYLAYGVTTTTDVSMYSQNMFPTAELIEVGEMIGPRGFSTGDNITAGDASRANEMNTPADALSAVRKMADWGAVSIKQYAQSRRDQRQWMAEASRTVGINETSEGGHFFENLGFIMDGQTGWEHSFSELPMYSDGAKFLGKAGATYSPTLVVAGPSAWSIEYWFQESDVWKDPKQRLWFPWRMLVPQTRVRWQRPATDYSYPLVAQAMADIIAEGGWGAIGSHGEQHGIAPHWEVWMGASALGTMGALEVASLHGARFLGADKDLGSIEVGKIADLMVLNKNPLDNIRNTIDAQYVMKSGTLYDAMSLDQLWPKAVPFGPKYWANDEVMQVNTKKTDTFDRPKKP